jgi:hypothetical protein
LAEGAWNWKYLILGGPPLIFVGNSVFYFLSALIVLTFLAGLLMRVAHARIYAWLGVVGALAWYETCQILNWQIPYWRPDGLVIWVFLAYLLKDSSPQGIIRVVLVLAPIVLLIHDRVLWYWGCNSSNYGSVFIVSLAVSLYLIVRAIPTGMIPGIATLMSRYSLGLFAVHQWIILAAWPLHTYPAVFVPVVILVNVGG